MTIKAHLKTELKRRTAQASIGNATPAAAAPTPTPAPIETPTAAEETPAPAAVQESDTTGTVSDATAEAANDESAVAPSIEKGDEIQGDALPADVSL